MGIMSRHPSLKARILGIVLILFISSFVLLTFSIEKKLEQDICTLLEAQQLATVSYIASEIDADIVRRIDVLNRNAKLVVPFFDLPERVRDFLKERTGSHALFPAGIVVIDNTGKGIADYPIAAKRDEAFFGELEYFREAITTGITVIGKPRIGRFTKMPGVAIAVPVRSDAGEIIGVIAGFATLEDKNLFGQIEYGMAGKSGSILVTDPRYAVIVSSNNPDEILQPATLSVPEIVSENSGLSVNYKGVDALIFSKAIPSTGWLVQMILPKDDVLAPIHQMRYSAYGMSATLTLLTLFSVLFFIRRALKPLETATSCINAMAVGKEELHTLPLSGDAEIQNLVQSFNTLVNQRKQSEKTIYESKARLNRAELISKSGNWEIHLDTQTVIGSEGAARIYGLDKDQCELVTVQQFPFPEYRPLLDSALKNLIEKNEPYDLEFKIRAADSGETKNIHAIATYDKEKRIVFGVIQDITERSRIQEALQDEASRRRIIFEQSRDGIALLRSDGSVAEVNSAFSEMLGYSSKELEQMSVSDWDVQLSRDEQEKIRLDPDLKHLVLETRHRRKDGSQYDVEVSINAVKWSGERYFYTLHRDITVRKQTEEALRKSEEYFRNFFEKNSSVMLLVDPASGRIISANKAATDYYGYPANLLIGMRTKEISAQSPESIAEEGLRIIREESDSFLLSQRLASGEVRDVEVHLSPIERGGRPLIFAIIHDITQRKQAEAKLRLAATVFSHAGEGILITAPNGKIIDTNDTFSSITGFGRDEILGRNPRFLKTGLQGKEFYKAMWRSLTDNGYWRGEIWNQRKNGEVFAAMLTISAVLDPQGHTQQYVALFSDITRLKEHERQLEHMAHYDALTSLPNRILFADRLQQAMSQTVRRGQRLAVGYLDLDGFKTINDNYGHETGDQLLMIVASRMKESLREGDTLARIGGDEFAAVLIDLPDNDASLPILKRLLSAAAQEVFIGDLVLQISVSLGITFYPQQDDVGADQLLRQADHAMYQAKMAGKNRCQVFEVASSK